MEMRTQMTIYEGSVYQDRLNAMSQNSDVWYSLRGCSVLITGASGMIGSCLVDYLMFLNQKYGAGISVYAMGRSEDSARRRFRHWCGQKYFHFIKHDVRERLDANMQIDYIIHAATSAHPAAYADTPADISLANYMGTLHLLDYLKSHQGKRFLFISSGEIYGQSDIDGGFDEDSCGYTDPLSPRSCYPMSKLAAENLCVCYLRQYGVESIIVRPSHVYGPTSTKQDTRAVTAFLQHAATGQDIVMYSEGTQVRNYCYVFDCVEGVLCALTRGVPGRAYNIADEKSIVSIKELADLIAELGKVNVIIDLPNEKMRSGFTSITHGVLNAKAMKQLGWTAKVHVREGLEETLSVLRED